MLHSEKSDLEAALSKLESEHQSLQVQHDGLVFDKAKLLATESDLWRALTGLRIDHNSLQAKHEQLESANKELLTSKSTLEGELSQIQIEHDKLERKYGELQAIYLPYKEEIEIKIADKAKRFTELKFSAEHLLSNLKEFLGQNTTLSELPSLMLLSRQIKTAIKDKKLKSLSSDYEKLVSALDGIPAYSTFLDAKEKARQEELARLEAEKKEEARRKKEEEERRQQAEAERKRKAEEATVEKGKELALEMRRYVVENMDAEDIEDRLADLAQLEAAIEKKDYAVMRSFVGTDEAEKRRLAEEQEKKQDNLSALPSCIEQQPVGNNCVGARAFGTRKDEYVGEFKDNKKHGHGIYTWTNGDKYVGQFMNGRQHGQGTFTYSVGAKFVGEWKDDKRHGQGTFTYASGGKYVGEWKDGKEISRGPYINADGTVVKQYVPKSGGREHCLENVRKNLAVLRRAFDDPTCKAWFQANLATQYERCVARRIEQMGYSSVKGFFEFRGDGLIRSLESWQLEYANFDVCPK